MSDDVEPDASRLWAKRWKARAKTWRTLHGRLEADTSRRCDSLAAAREAAWRERDDARAECGRLYECRDDLKKRLAEVLDDRQEAATYAADLLAAARVVEPRVPASAFTELTAVMCRGPVAITHIVDAHARLIAQRDTALTEIIALKAERDSAIKEGQERVDELRAQVDHLTRERDEWQRRYAWLNDKDADGENLRLATELGRAHAEVERLKGLLDARTAQLMEEQRAKREGRFQGAADQWRYERDCAREDAADLGARVERLEAERDEARAEVERLTRPHPRSEWHDDDGPVLWWTLPVNEPPYVGSPLEDDFPDYLTHWTRLPSALAVVSP